MLRFLQTPTTTKKVVLGAMLLFIAVMMVVTLIPGIYDSLTGTRAGSGVYAKVGDQEIRTQELDENTRVVAQRQHLPEQFAPMIRPQVAQRMIQEAALISEAHRLGLKVSDEELRNELQKNPQWGPYIFPNGNFVGRDKYVDFVQRAFQMSTDRFESLLRDELLKRKLYAVIGGAVGVSDAEVESTFRKQNEKVKFDYALISTPDLMKQVTVTDQEMRAYYEQHKAEYANSIPEKRKLRFIAIDGSKVPSTVTAADILNFYNQNQDQFREDEQVKASHILVATKPGADGKVDPKADEAAKAKAQGLLNQLKAGANFEELAKKNSDDPGSGAKGGDLGWFGRKAMVPEFEQAAFGLQHKGQLSDLVKTNFGYHIIRLDDKKPARIKPLEEVKDQIRQSLEATSKQKAIADLGNKVLEEAKKNGLEKAAVANGAQVVTTDFVSQTDSLPGIGNSLQFGQAAFAPSAKPKSAPELAKTDSGVAIFEVLDVRPPATPTFEEARQRIEQSLRNEKAGKMLQDKTEQLAEKAKSYHDLKKAAKEVGATVKSTPDFVDGKAQVPDLGSLAQGPAQVAFSLEPGQISDALSAGRNGAVLQVVEKKQPSAEEFAKQKEVTRDALLDRRRGEMVALYTDSLVKRMKDEGKIKLNKEEEQKENAGGLPTGNF